MAFQRQATIVGASVAGLATACALAERGWPVTVLERRADLLEGGRAILLQPNGLDALDRLGALSHVRERGQRLSRVVFHGRRHRPVAAWDYGELRHPHPYAVEVRPSALRSSTGSTAETTQSCRRKSRSTSRRPASSIYRLTSALVSK